MGEGHAKAARAGGVDALVWFEFDKETDWRLADDEAQVAPPRCAAAAGAKAASSPPSSAWSVAELDEQPPPIALLRHQDPISTTSRFVVPHLDGGTRMCLGVPPEIVCVKGGVDDGDCFARRSGIPREAPGFEQRRGNEHDEHPVGGFRRAVRVPRHAGGRTLRPGNPKEEHRPAKEDFKRRAWRTALLTVGLLAALIFGAIVLAGGDWIPGTIIVVAMIAWPGRSRSSQGSVAGRARQQQADGLTARRVVDHPVRMIPGRPGFSNMALPTPERRGKCAAGSHTPALRS